MIKLLPSHRQYIMITTTNLALSLEEFLQQPEIQAELVSTINQITKPKKIAYALPELRCTFGENRSYLM